MNLKKIGKVFTSKFVGTGPSSYEQRIYRAAVSQRLRNTGLEDINTGLEDINTGLEDINTGLEDINTGVEDVNTGLEDINTGLEDINVQELQNVINVAELLPGTGCSLEVIEHMTK